MQAHLEQRAAAAPVLVCLDDLQWASPATLAALRTLPRELKRHPVAWILARSTTPQQDTEYLFSLLEKEGATRIILAPLGDDAVTALLTDAFGAPPDPGLLALACGAAGNPSLLAELVSGLRDDDAVEVTGGRAVLVSARLPRRIHLVTQRRLDGLSKQARHLLVTGGGAGPVVSARRRGRDARRNPRRCYCPRSRRRWAPGSWQRPRHAFSFRHELLCRAAGGA